MNILAQVAQTYTIIRYTVVIKLLYIDFTVFLSSKGAKAGQEIAMDE
jgi:hypothetical protein